MTEQVVDVLPKGKLVGTIKEKIPLLGYMDKMGTAIGEKIRQAKDKFVPKISNPDEESPGSSE